MLLCAALCAIGAPPGRSFDSDGACRKRLKAITTDPVILDGFERVIKTGKFGDAFLEAFYGASLSLDYVLFGKGEPFLTDERMANA